jgi:hypothetical protein
MAFAGCSGTNNLSFDEVLEKLSMVNNYSDANNVCSKQKVIDQTSCFVASAISLDTLPKDILNCYSVLVVNTDTYGSDVDIQSAGLIFSLALEIKKAGPDYKDFVASAIGGTDAALFAPVELLDTAGKVNILSARSECFVIVASTVETLTSAGFE